jgi:HK97 family phage major capsid protein
MKRIDDLKQKRYTKLNEMKDIVDQVVAENRSKDEDETKRYDSIDKEVKGIDLQIKELESQEELNKRMGTPLEIKTTDDKKSVVVEFRDWLKESVNQGKTSQFNGLAEYRADPILTTTDTAVINKTVANYVDILRSPGEAFLRQLGCTFYTGLVGNFVVPNMAEDTAAFVGEDVSAASANMGLADLTLAARRVTHTQAITKETLAQTNPSIYASILQNLVNGLWNAVTNDVFDTIDSDGATQKSTYGAGTLSYKMLLQQEASIGGLNIGAGAYVTTPTVKAYLKGTAGLTNQAAMWTNNEVNGYPAYGVTAANTGEIYFGDFSREAIGQWGGIEVIVDPYTDAKKGEIHLTAIGMFDTGVTNPRAFAILTNASTA